LVRVLQRENKLSLDISAYRRVEHIEVGMREIPCRLDSVAQERIKWKAVVSVIRTFD
jgi:hypothetical protein